MAEAGRQCRWNGYLLVCVSGRNAFIRLSKQMICHLIFHSSVHVDDIWCSGLLWCPSQSGKKPSVIKEHSNSFHFITIEPRQFGNNMNCTFPDRIQKLYEFSSIIRDCLAIRGKWNVSEPLKLCVCVCVCLFIYVCLCSWMTPVHQREARSTSSQMWKRWLWWRRWRNTWNQRRVGQMVRPLLPSHPLRPLHSTETPLG